MPLPAAGQWAGLAKAHGGLADLAAAAPLMPMAPPQLSSNTAPILALGTHQDVCPLGPWKHAGPAGFVMYCHNGYGS